MSFQFFRNSYIMTWCYPVLPYQQCAFKGIPLPSLSPERHTVCWTFTDSSDSEISCILCEFNCKYVCMHIYRNNYNISTCISTTYMCRHSSIEIKGWEISTNDGNMALPNLVPVYPFLEAKRDVGTGFDSRPCLVSITFGDAPT